MNEVNDSNKKNKELEPNNRERNLKEYNSDDREIEIQNAKSQSKSQQEQQHIHDDDCSCGH